MIDWQRQMLLKTLVTYLLCVDVVFLFYLLFSARVWFYNCHHRPAGWRTGTGLDEDLHQPNSPYEQGNFRFGCLVLLRLGWDCVGFKKILYIKREPLLSAKSQRIISGFRKVSLERRKESSEEENRNKRATQRRKSKTKQWP